MKQSVRAPGERHAMERKGDLMRNVRITVAAIALAGAVVLARADEGMWMLHQVSELDVKLKTMGSQLTSEDLWNPATGSGLASATPSLGGCSASFVSPDGLVVTNHHCAFGAIQQNSSPEHDYITEGFLARKRSEELPARTSRVYVFKGYQDVTDQVRTALTADLGPEQRVRAVERRQKELVASCEQDGLRCRVAEMFAGQKFYLFRQLEIRDVRLVYAPPRGIGEYGGDIDNWMWPRHTGDFSFLRAYVGPDGKPADFSPDNVPFKPDRFLTIATEPVREGDFTMIVGYPGKTLRYRRASEIANDLSFWHPQRIQMLRDWIAILEKRGATSKEVEIKLASTVKGLHNGLKKTEGMLLGLTQSGLADTKRAEESKLAAWVAADAVRTKRWGQVLDGIEMTLAARQSTRERDLLLGSVTRSSSILGAASTLTRWCEEKGKPDLDRKEGYQARDERSIRMRLTALQRNLDVATEKAALGYFIRRSQDLPANQRIAAFDRVLAETGKTGEEAINTMLNRLFSGTRLTDQAVRLGLLDLDAAALATRKDPMLDLAAELLVITKANDQADEHLAGEMLVLGPAYMEALATFRQSPLYPDANSTIRFTYATVKGYYPRDAVYYKPFTTLEGVISKHTGELPFDSPPSLLLAREKVGPGRYLDTALGALPVNFLSTNDITGGNSGSPIMNGKGELIGLAFDGNWESMTADYEFDPALTRTINVDARYMLWVMEHVDRAHNLLQEMGVPVESR